jgi:hypothetical protein
MILAIIVLPRCYRAMLSRKLSPAAESRAMVGC